MNQYEYKVWIFTDETVMQDTLNKEAAFGWRLAFVSALGRQIEIKYIRSFTVILERPAIVKGENNEPS